MRPSKDLPVVYLCREAVDFRKGINGLAALVEAELDLDPFSEQLFVFCNRRRNRVRILYWLLDGIDVLRVQPHARLHYRSVL